MEFTRKGHILKAMEPSMGQCTNTVYDGVNQHCLQQLDLALSKVLMLIMGLTLPIINAVSMQDFLDLVDNFNLCPITD